MNHRHPKIPRAFTCAITFVAMAALSACNDEEKESKQPESSSVAVHVESNEENYDDLNSTLIAKFPSPGQSDESSSLDILRPETSFRLYNNLRTWDEDGKDIATLLETSLGEGGDDVLVFKLGWEYGGTNDAFKKRDLEQKILAETQREAEQVEGLRSVKFLSEPGKIVSLELGHYNFDEMSFRIDHCLFSDKLEYSKEEMRLAQSLRGSDQKRCYFRAANTELRVGFVGGSVVRFKVENPELARNIEAQRSELKIAVYGYVESVQREKVGGNLVKERLVLIAPQRVLLMDASGQILSEATL